MIVASSALSSAVSLIVNASTFSSISDGRRVPDNATDTWGFERTQASASRGKVIRAEPIAAIYARNEAHHVGRFPELERQMCEWTPVSGYSPDRLDAMVWGMSDVMEGSSAAAFLSALKDQQAAPKAGLSAFGYRR